MSPTHSPEKEARKALNRLRRSLEKSVREMHSLEGALRSAESDDFPSAAYDEARLAVDRLLAFLDEEERRLRDKVLAAGGLEPGRVRRASTLD